LSYMPIIAVNKTFYRPTKAKTSLALYH